MAGERKGTAGMLLLAAVAVLVVAVEGASLFTVWNLLPLAVASVVLRSAGRARAAGLAPSPSRAPELALVGTVAIVVGGAHVAWMFDWRGTATGSSTAALLFVVLPLLALMAGAAAWVAARLARHLAV